MTKLDQTLEFLQSARRAQAVVNAHLAAERQRATACRVYEDARSAYVNARGLSTCQRGRECRCGRCQQVEALRAAQEAAWSEWRRA